MKQPKKLTSVVLIFMILVNLACRKPQNSNSNSVIFSKTYPPLNYTMVGALINGKKNGLWIKFDSSGIIQTEETFVNGKSFGETKLFVHGRLILRTKDTVIKSDTNEIFQEYNADGVLITIGQYVNGKKRGIWKYFQNNGLKLKSQIDYETNGKKVLYQDSIKDKGDF